MCINGVKSRWSSVSRLVRKGRARSTPTLPAELEHALFRQVSPQSNLPPALRDTLLGVASMHHLVFKSGSHRVDLCLDHRIRVLFPPPTKGSVLWIIVLAYLRDAGRNMERWRAETEPVRSLVFGGSLGYNQNQQRHETEEKKPQCRVQRRGQSFGL